MSAITSNMSTYGTPDGVQPILYPLFHTLHILMLQEVIEGVSEAIAAMECLAATTTAMVYMVTGQ